MTRCAPTPEISFRSITLLVLAACSGGGYGVSPILNHSIAPAPPHRAAGAAGATQYAVTDLGLGEVSTLASLTYTQGLNSRGVVAGANTAPVATLFNHGKTKDLQTIPASGSYANAMNDSGQIVGSVEPGTTCCFDAFLYQNGSMKDINDASLFPNGSDAYAINKSGQVVGVGTLAGTGFFFHAFLYSGGKMVDLDPFGGFQSYAVSINDSGEIIGTACCSPTVATWLYASGKFTNLSSSDRGYFINDNGQIVGSNGRDGVLYSNGAWKDLGTFPDATSMVAVSINAHGVIVGTAIHRVRSRCNPSSRFSSIAVILRSSGWVDLNTEVSSTTFTLTNAAGVNDSGQIAADATDTSCGTHVVLLTPH
jgi:probable HAF family extracellular repeat protein